MTSNNFNNLHINKYVFIEIKGQLNSDLLEKKIICRQGTDIYSGIILDINDNCIKLKITKYILNYQTKHWKELIKLF